MKTKTKEKTKKKLIKPPKKEFKLFLKFNDQSFEVETDDIATSFIELKPLILKTRLQIEIEKNGKKYNRIVFVPKGRMLFNNKSWLNTFIIHAKRYLN